MTVSWTSRVLSAGEDDFLQFSTRTAFSCLIFFRIKDVRDRSAIMVCEVTFGVIILPVYSPLSIKVK